MENENDLKEAEIQQRIALLNFTTGDLNEEQLLAEQNRSRVALRSGLMPKSPRILSIRKWMAAASVLLVLCTAIYYQVSKREASLPNKVLYGQTSTAKGERKTIILSDGSRITLNSASLLKYPKSFDQKNREVELFGQAFFEVKRDTTKPFIIHASKIDVQVLGTTFDISNYKEEEKITVTVNSGKVKVQSLEHNSSILLPGDQSVYHTRTGQFTNYKVEPEAYTSWQKGYYVFEDQQIASICKQLERAYNVEFHIEDPLLKSKKMTFRVRGENISRVVDMLALVGGFHYVIKDRTITLKLN